MFMSNSGPHQNNVTVCLSKITMDTITMDHIAGVLQQSPAALVLLRSLASQGTLAIEGTLAIARVHKRQGGKKIALRGGG